MRKQDIFGEENNNSRGERRRGGKGEIKTLSDTGKNKEKNTQQNSHSDVHHSLIYAHLKKRSHEPTIFSDKRLRPRRTSDGHGGGRASFPPFSNMTSLRIKPPPRHNTIRGSFFTHSPIFLSTSFKTAKFESSIHP